MCGIHFVLTSSAYAANVDDFMLDGFVVNQVRGTHSSGIFQLNKAQLIMHKAAVKGSDFVDIKEARSIIKDANRATLTVGHVRHATAGKVAIDNAHPFSVTREDGSKVIGVHNGTLRDWKHKKGGDEFEVDSEWAFATIAREGVGAFRYFDGAYAFVWYDTREPDVLFMARNNERPLHFMRAADGKTILGASELGMLGWVAERNKINMIADKENAGMLFLVPDKMYKFDLNNVGEYSFEDVPKYDTSTGVYKATQNFHMGHGNSHRGFSNYSQYYDDEEYGMSDWFPATPFGMEEKLEYVGKALHEVRKIRLQPTTQESKVENVNTPDTTLEKDIRAAITDFNDKASISPMYEQLSHNPLFVYSPNESYAGKAEIKKAKDMQIFGQVVLMEGVLHDDDTATILGEFIIVEEGGAKISVSAEMRLCTSRDVYTYVSKHVPVVVVGYNEGKTSGYSYASVAPLTKPQLAVINHKLQTKLRMVAN